MTTTELEPVAGEIEQTTPLLPSGLVDVERARAAMTNYQELCAAVLEPEDWIGRPGEPESFVRKSGWMKLAKFYSVSVELVGETKLERDDDGRLIRASARARATDPRDGRVSEAGGACARNEDRFRTSQGRLKIEHDLPSSAETRAANRAISNLVGFGAISAEEADGGSGSSSSSVDLPAWAEDIPEQAIDRFGDNLETIIFAASQTTRVSQTAVDVGNALVTYCDGAVPAAAARLAHLLAQAVKPTAPGVPYTPEEAQANEAAAAPDIPASPGGES
jgi:hypothetical protein